VALCGDGGVLLNISELATAAQEKIPVVTVVFNDSAFGLVKQEQRRRYDGRFIATDPLAPDYVARARAFHVRAERVETPEALGEALRVALDHDGPSLIEVQLPPRTW
jgi:acetolactate synthase-1/2/3 large subunit